MWSPSPRRAWIEIGLDLQQRQRRESPSSRRAWIEIFCQAQRSDSVEVALLAEGVDRNSLTLVNGGVQDVVALLAEGVDRNPFCGHLPVFAKEVALLAEGVDRNVFIVDTPLRFGSVALLAEGVDRNTYYDPRLAALGESPSSRRAWIEMLGSYLSQLVRMGRPPRGGRG